MQSQGHITLHTTPASSHSRNPRISQEVGDQERVAPSVHCPSPGPSLWQEPGPGRERTQRAGAPQRASLHPPRCSSALCGRFAVLRLVTRLLGSGFSSEPVFRRKSPTWSPPPRVDPRGPSTLVACEGEALASHRAPREACNCPLAATCPAGGPSAGARLGTQTSWATPEAQPRAVLPTLALSLVAERTDSCDTYRVEHLEGSPVHAHRSPEIKPRAMLTHGQTQWHLRHGAGTRHASGRRWDRSGSRAGRTGQERGEQPARCPEEACVPFGP